MDGKIANAYVRFIGSDCSLKNQRECAYELLRFVADKVFSIKDFRIFKDKNGRPYTDEFCFSISHTRCAVAVVVSVLSVGIDAELESSKALRTMKKVFSRNGEVEPVVLDEAIATEIWTENEAEFKAQGGTGFCLKGLCERGQSVVTDRVMFDGGILCVSVAGDFECVELVVLNEDWSIFDTRFLRK